MNLSELPTYRPDIHQLKNQLEKLCGQYAIVKFEASDMVELLEDGEEVNWIVDQLKNENQGIDSAAFTGVLTDIRSIIAPPEEEEAAELGKISDVVQDASTEPSVHRQLPDLSQLDLSQLELPSDMKLPPGVNMKQIQKIMESPQGEFLADFSMFMQEKGLADFQSTLSDAAGLKALNEEWMSTPRPAFDGKTPAEMLQGNPSLMPQKVETYRREEPRVGRNDPCPCGSGKKYKKCCGIGK